MNKTKKIAFGIGIVLAVLAMLTAPAAADGVVYFQPDPSTVSLAPGENVTIQIMADVDATESGLISLQVGVDFDPSVVNITDVTNPWVFEPWVTWWMQSFLWDNPSDEDPGPLGAWVWITAAHNSCYDAPVTEVQVANLTIEGVSGGTSPLNFTGEIRLEPTRGMSWLFDCTGSPVLPTTWNNGTIECTGASDVDNKTTEDIPVSGTMSGNHTLTHESGDVYESITEVLSTGKPAWKQYSYLEHKWTIDVIDGSKTNVTFYLEAYHSLSSDGDDFVFAYSTDDSTYTDMATVIKTADDNTYQTYELPSDLSGTVYIRVKDTDRNKGNQDLDTIHIDQMFIRSVLAPPSYGVTVTIDEASQTVAPGNGTTYTVRVKNTGDFDASYSVVMSGTAVTDATIGVSPLNWNTGTLVPNAENVQTVTVSTNSSTPETTYTLIATATCDQDAGVNDSATSELVVSSVTNAMHVACIDMSFKTAGPNRNAIALVTIVDATGAPVEGATVDGHWSGATTDTDSGLTDASGEVALDSDKVRNAPSGTIFTFTVDDVSLTGWTYDYAANAETSDSITV